ncbi:MAG TPA: hypothetical protein VGL61_15970 [Kofleriaceae bacterium]|jgi:hypothetical protein
MQFAERSRATGSIILALIATAALVITTLAVAQPQHWRHHRHHDRGFAYDLGRCREHIAPRVEPPAPVDASRPTTYDGVLASATPLFARCFAHDGRATELLVTIAPDGRVRATTSRPEPETHTSRCLANVVRGLVFPPAATTVMMRVPLAPRR